MANKKNEAEELKDTKAKLAAYRTVCADLVRRCEANTGGWTAWGGRWSALSTRMTWIWPKRSAWA